MHVTLNLFIRIEYEQNWISPESVRDSLVCKTALESTIHYCSRTRTSATIRADFLDSNRGFRYIFYCFSGLYSYVQQDTLIFTSKYVYIYKSYFFINPSNDLIIYFDYSFQTFFNANNLYAISSAEVKTRLNCNPGDASMSRVCAQSRGQALSRGIEVSPNRKYATSK